MKKLIAMLLCVALVAALGTSAFAGYSDETTASAAAPTATAPKDTAAAVADKVTAGQYDDLADDAALVASALAALKKIDDAYLKVVGNPSKTAADVAAAKVVWTDAYNAWDASLASITMSDGTTTLDSAAIAIGASLSVDMSNYAGGAYDIDTVLAANNAASGYTKAAKIEAAADLAAAGWQNAAVWDLSNQSLMDTTAFSEANASLDWAATKKDAEAAAKSAKNAAVAAQANAKTLINLAISVAQDAVAVAVADQQTAAYNKVAAAYAVATADFWADVNDAIAELFS